MSKTSKHLLPIIIAGILVFFAGTSVAQAGCDAPLTCSKDGWTITLNSVEPAVCPEGIDYEECYKWTYHVVEDEVGNAQALSQLNFTIPVTCPTTELLDEYNLGIAYYDPGVGDKTTGFGWGIEHIYIIKIPPQAFDEWSYIANTGKMSTGTYGLKAGKLFSPCEIAVPDINGDDPNEILVFSAEVIVGTSDGKQFKIIEDADTGCILAAFEKYCPDVGSTCGDWDMIGETECCWKPMQKRETRDVLKAEGDGWEAEVEFVGGHTNRYKCNRSIVKSKGDHTWYLLSGIWMWF